MVRLTLIGFGEAGSGFAAAASWGRDAHVYDRLTDDPATRTGIEAAYRSCGVQGLEDPAAAVANSPIVLSLVTADQAIAAARACSQAIAPAAFFCDFNSVAPATKRQAANAIEAAGAHYVDVAVMAPVRPALLDVPLLLSGAAAAEARVRLGLLGFTHVRVVGAEVGQASAIKMIRSVIVKGLEALTAEAMLAAAEAGVTNEVIASLDASEKGQGWAASAHYNLERMTVHGLRRAEELSQVAATLESLGVDPNMTRAAEGWQRAIGSAGVEAPADTLPRLLEQLRTQRCAA